MDSTISKKGKVAILIVCLVLAFPVYALSGYGMNKWVQQCYDRMDDAKTPERLLFLAKVQNTLYREAEAEQILREWLKHYGGDESEKDPGWRYISWDGSYPWNEDHPRPPQKGEDYRKDPHPLTGQALILFAEHEEHDHQYVYAKHLFEIIINSEKWNIPKDADAMKRAQNGVERNTSGRNNF